MMRNSVFAGHSSLTNFFCTESDLALWTYSWKKIGEKRENKKFKKLEKTLFTKPAQRVSQDVYKRQPLQKVFYIKPVRFVRWDE